MVLDWFKAIGQIVFSWPVIVLVVLIMFRNSLGLLLKRFAGSSDLEASLGPLTIKLGKLAEEGKTAVGRFYEITEVMAESRLFELEVTQGIFGSLLSEEQQQQLQEHIRSLRSLMLVRDQECSEKNP